MLYGSQYFSNKVLTVNVHPWNATIPVIPTEVNITVVNTETTVSMNTSMVNSTTSVVIDAARQRPYNQSIDESGWFTGSVVRYDIKCPYTPNKTCDGFLALHNHIEHNMTATINLTNPVDIYNDRLTGYVYYLTHSHLLVLDSQLNVISKPIYLDIDPPSHCLKLVPQTLTIDNQIRLAALFAICFDENSQLFVTVPINLLNPDTAPGQPAVLQKTTNFG